MNIFKLHVELSAIVIVISLYCNSDSNDNNIVSGQTLLNTNCGDTIADGGFELGSPNAQWSESSSSAFTLICDNSCGFGSPNSGAFWVWLGDAVNEVAGVSQNAVINSGALSLEFYISLPSCEVGSADTFSITIDGLLMYSTDGNDPRCNIAGYVKRSINISSFADGGQHAILFNSSNDPLLPTSFLIDDVKILCQ